MKKSYLSLTFLLYFSVNFILVKVMLFMFIRLSTKRLRVKFNKQKDYKYVGFRKHESYFTKKTITKN